MTSHRLTHCGAPFEEAIPMTTLTTAHAPPRAATGEPRRFRPDIQGLRAVAILLVVLYHAGIPGISGGFVGVDVFFVISGFLITRALHSEIERKGRVSFLAFYGRRMRRLIPAAALVIVVTLLLGRFLLPATSFGSLVRDAWFTASYGMNYHLAVEGVQYQNAGAPPSALQHFWSLAVEEQFYLVWPLLLAACAVLVRRRWRRTAMVLAIAAVNVVTLWFSITVTPVNTSLAYFSLHTRAWELGAGALAALTLPLTARIPGRVAVVGGWIGLGLIVAAAVAYSDTTAYPGSAAIVPVLGTTLLVAAGTHRNARSAETALLARPPMQYMGKVSYAWYMWHWPLLILLPLWAGRDLGWAGNLELVVISFWFAVLTYFLENASHRSNLSLRRWVPTGLAISSGVAVTGLVLTFTLPALVGSGQAIAATPLRTADVTTVQAALARGAQITALPSNLTPALTDVQDDLPKSTADGCHAALLDVDAKTCTYGATAWTKTAVLVGDSHAQQWLGGLIPSATADGWRIVTYTKAACPVAETVVWNNDLNRMYNECDTWRAAAYPAIEALAPDLIIASQSDAVPWDSVTDKAWADETVATLKKLAGPSTRIAFIGDTPQTADDPVLCLQQHLDDVRACDYPRRQAYEFFPNRHVEVGKSITAAGFAFMDPLDFFCTAQECPPIVGNMPVRRDSGHVTDTYATWLAPMLAPIFEDVK